MQVPNGHADHVAILVKGSDGKLTEYSIEGGSPNGLKRQGWTKKSINAGDKIWAQVRWSGKGRFVATLINLTRRVGATQAWTLHLAPLLTAEWIVEEPAASCSGGSCTFVTLARFAPVTLNGSVTVSGSNYRLSVIPFPYLRTSINRAGRSLAVPSSLSSRGFKVTWKSS